jgi:hypothetical protein
MNYESDDPRTWGERRPPASGGGGMDPVAERLYNIYAGWSGQLHHYCQHELGQDLDVEFFPADWEMRLYPPNTLDIQISQCGIPGIVRPSDSRPFRLPRPENDPTPEELDQAFRGLCYAAALVLKIKLGKGKLEDGPAHRSDPRALLPPDEP